MQGGSGSAQECRARIEAKLRAALAPEYLEVVDESELHRGHPGAASGGGHFRVRLASSEFEGCSRTQRHRIVYRALQDFMGPEIHALALELYTPGEWDESTS